MLVERIDMGAVSGAADVRPDLQRLFRLAEARAFDELRVRHLDRLTRHDDLRQRAEIFGRLLDASAIIVDGSGHVIDPSTELGELDYSLQTWMSAKERRRIRERTLAARKRLASEGAIQGQPPYGRTWDKKTKTWGEDPEEMAIYRRMFREVLAGASLSKISDGLNRDGLQTPRGSEWSPAHVSRLLRSKSATGLLEGWGHIYRCPAVVTEREWKTARATLAANWNHRSGAPGTAPALLRRALICGPCGAAMWVQRSGRSGQISSFYVCSTHRKTTEKECRRYHAAEPVDEEVQRAILAELRQPARISGAAQKRAAADATAEARQAVATATKELRDLDKREEKLARLTTKGLLSERTGVAQLSEIAKLRNAAEVELNAATGRLEALERAAKESEGVAIRASKIAAGLEQADYAMWRRFIQEQFPRPGYGIRLYPDGRIVLSGLFSAFGGSQGRRVGSL